MRAAEGAGGRDRSRPVWLVVVALVLVALSFRPTGAAFTARTSAPATVSATVGFDSALLRFGASVQTPARTPLQTGSGTDWSTVAFGDTTCGLRTDGSLWCWGDTPVRVGTASWTSISTTQANTCGLQTDHSLWCWGENGSGQLGTGDAASYTSPTRIGNDTDWSSVSVGYGSSCGIRTDGTLWCWGSNAFGELGIGDPSLYYRLTPTQAGSATSWTSVTGGSLFACGLQSDGSLWCWGENGSTGTVGTGDSSTATYDSPVRIGSDSWKSVTAGRDYVCAVRSDDTLWCWGAPPGRTLGTPSLTVPTQVGTATWATLSATGYGVCGTQTDGTLWCWGKNTHYVLGVGDGADRSAPTQVGTGTTWAGVTGSVNGSCAIRTDHTLWCWGSTNLGTATTTPVLQISSRGWTAAGTGPDTACGLRGTGQLWCWGASPNGELGLGAVVDQPTPTRVDTATTWATLSLSAAGSHACATRTDGTLWCWGNNTSGQLGDGGTTTRTTPNQVPGTTWQSVATGTSHTCAVRTDRTLWCWGDNSSGQLGQGGTTAQTSPVQVPGTTWASAAAGGNSTCAVRTDHTLWCWGDGTDGQLGVGGITVKDTPTQVGTATTWSAVDVSPSNSCGVRTDGALWCWGDNTGGAIGDGTTTGDGGQSGTVRMTPKRVGTLTAWVDVTVGTGTACGRQSDGSAWCWGQNGSGQLGLGDTTDRTVPTRLDLPSVSAIDLSAINAVLVV